MEGGELGVLQHFDVWIKIYADLIGFREDGFVVWVVRKVNDVLLIGLADVDWLIDTAVVIDVFW